MEGVQVYYLLFCIVMYIIYKIRKRIKNGNFDYVFAEGQVDIEHAILEVSKKTHKEFCLAAKKNKNINQDLLFGRASSFEMYSIGYVHGLILKNTQSYAETKGINFQEEKKAYIVAHVKRILYAATPLAKRYDENGKTMGDYIRGESDAQGYSTEKTQHLIDNISENL